MPAPNASTPAPGQDNASVFRQLADDRATGLLWTGVGTAVVAVGLLLVPRERRGQLRLPLLAWVVHVLASAIDAAATPGGLLALMIHPIVIATQLVVIGHGALAVLADGLLPRRGWEVPKIFRDILAMAVWFVTVLSTLHASGVEPGSLLATSALVTMVLGLSLQDTLGNLFAGLAIQAQRPFQLGDWVQLADSNEPLGRVIEINWRATKVLTNDRVEVIVPNGSLAKSQIRNFSKPTTSIRRKVLFTAPYEYSPAHIRELVQRAIDGTDGVMTDRAPELLVSDFAADGVLYTVRYFTDQPENVTPIDARVRERLWYAFRRANISFPFPQREIRVETVQAGDRERARDDKLAARRRSLAQVDLFASLPQDALDLLAGLTQTRRFAAGEFILHQGDRGSELFLIEHGKVSIRVGAAPGQEVAQLGKGQCFGEMSLMTGAARAAHVRAVEDVAALVVDKAAFQQVLHLQPELAERISQLLASRQEQLSAQASKQSGVVQIEDKSQAILSKIKEFFAI